MLCIPHFSGKRRKLIGQNKVKICQVQSQNIKFLGQKIGCPTHNCCFVPVDPGWPRPVLRVRLYHYQPQAGRSGAFEDCWSSWPRLGPAFVKQGRQADFGRSQGAKHGQRGRCRLTSQRWEAASQRSLVALNDAISQSNEAEVMSRERDVIDDDAMYALIRRALLPTPSCYRRGFIRGQRVESFVHVR